MLLEAAINGTRTRAEHPAIPLTPAEQAAAASAVVAAGAGAIHVHVRAPDGRESLAADDVARAVGAIRAACPGVPVGVSTGAWIVPDPARRLSVIGAWEVRPDFASVNVHEDGAVHLMRRLMDLRIGVEAGIWNARAAELLLGSGLARACLRLVIEPAEEPGDPRATLDGIEAVAGRLGRPRLLHGAGAWTWELIRVAAERGYDTRIGFEDTLTLPDGSRAASNAELVAAALQIVGASARSAG